MNAARWVGVLGGSGAVGRAALSALVQRPDLRLRAGARRVPQVALPSDEARVELTHVDVFDPTSLARFVAGCSVVVNCSGPSYRVLDRVARAALAAGAHYVDATGDDPVFERLCHDDAAGDRCAVLSAGTLPGLSALLPRWLAKREFDAMQRLVVYAGGLEGVTKTAAADFLLSLDHGYGTALAAFRDGAVAKRALAPSADVELPFFPGRVSAQPFLSTEAERLATELGLRDLEWFNVLAGEMLRVALTRLRGQTFADASDAELDVACQKVVAAAEVDLAGREPYQHMVFEASGTVAGRACTKTAVARMTDSYRVTGQVTALAAEAVLDGRVPAGTSYAAEVLDPERVVSSLLASGAIAGLDVLEGLVTAEATEEGEV